MLIRESGDVLKELGTGDFFGEIGILNLSGGQNRRIADVRSVGYTECFMLLREDVLAATRDYPEAQEILSAYGKERLKRTRKISTWREGLSTTVQDSNKRWPQFELQVLRESVSSVAAHENEAFAQESNGESRPQGFQNKAMGQNSGDDTKNINDENNLSNGTAKDAVNDTKSIKNSSNSQLKNCVQEQLKISQVENFERKLSQELKSVIKVKDKEISLLNDVIKELQRENTNDKQELQTLKTQHENSEKKVELLGAENLELKHENVAKDGTINLLRNKVEELQRTKAEQKEQEEIVITEVNECEVNC